MLSIWSNDHLDDYEMLSSVMAEGAEASADDLIIWLKIGCLSLSPVIDERVKDGNSRPVPEEKGPLYPCPVVDGKEEDEIRWAITSSRRLWRSLYFQASVASEDRKYS